jgi:UDP-2,3-diacylglucosamine hydrolase
MKAAEINAAALETGRVILLDKPAVLAQAKSWGIHLLGFE